MPSNFKELQKAVLNNNTPNANVDTSLADDYIKKAFSTLSSLVQPKEETKITPEKLNLDITGTPINTGRNSDIASAFSSGNYSPDSQIGKLIIETANAIGANPVDLATAISYETGGTFNPLQRGPTTKYGQHIGLIQFGEPQRQQYGVDTTDATTALTSQLGANGAVAKYFKDRGFKPGMGGLDLYSTINAGRPGLYSASDANNGGAAGTVADKWNYQMEQHKIKAMKLLGMS